MKFPYNEVSMTITSSAESQKGIITFQRCSFENQEAAIAIYFVQW